MINYTSDPFIDLDGDMLTLTQMGLPAPLVFTDNGDGTYTVAGTAPSGGPWTVSVTATDGNGGAVSQTLTIDCGAVNATIAFPIGLGLETSAASNAGQAIGRITFNPDGTYTILSDDGIPGGPTPETANWITPNNSAIGNDYEFRFTVISSTQPLTGGPVGTWLPLSSSQYVQLQDPTPGTNGFEQCQLQVEIREVATGNIIITQTTNWLVTQN